MIRERLEVPNYYRTIFCFVFFVHVGGLGQFWKPSWLSWLFGYIYLYADGHGRMARFLMNVMLASDGYPWTVIQVEDRHSYLDALDRASIDADIKPFAAFIAQRVRWSVERRKSTFAASGESYDHDRGIL
jgi:hypothetical protein